MDNKTIAFELAKKYTFKTFDFKTGTPEDLLKLYQDTEDKIYTILEEQTSEAVSSNLTDWLSS